LKKFFRNIINKLYILYLCTKSTSFFSRCGWCTVPFAIKLYNERHFMPKEMFAKGLLNPDSKDKALQIFLSRKEGTELQEAVNPEIFAPTLKNKALFYKMLKLADLPHPEVFAIFNKNTAGCDRSGNIIESKQQWEEFLENNIPNEFVMKPAYGTEGKGFKCIARHEDGFYSVNKRYSAEQLYLEMMEYPHCDCYIIQQKLTNHRAFESVTGPKALQTVRVVTFIRKDSLPVLIWSLPKFIVGNNVVDNTSHGRTNNFYSFADNQTGRVDKGFVFCPENGAIEDISLHPDTGKSIEGFMLPCWDEVVNLVKKASKVFLPIRSVGWDIAITDDGPFIVEGNIWWEVGGKVKAVKPIIDDIGYYPKGFNLRF
jgi:hypothetical protein